MPLSVADCLSSSIDVHYKLTGTQSAHWVPDLQIHRIVDLRESRIRYQVIQILVIVKVVPDRDHIILIRFPPLNEVKYSGVPNAKQSRVDEVQELRWADKGVIDGIEKERYL